MILSSLYGEFDPINPPPLPGLFARSVQADPVLIEASREEVWNTLADFERYPEWCRFTRRIELSDTAPGSDVRLHLRWDDKLDQPRQVQVEQLTIWDPGRAMGWALNWPGLKAERYQFLLQRPDGSTVYHTRDRFSGVLVPLVFLLYGKRMEQGFNRVAASLRQRVEEQILSGSITHPS